MPNIIDDNIETYVRQHNADSTPLLNELELATHETMEMPEMLSGPLAGQFLKMLVTLIQAKRILEIGMFTGYATLHFAEALPESGEIVTCELDKDRIAFATRFFERSPHGKKIKILRGEALPNVKKLIPAFDIVFIDADKTNYLNYYQEAVRLARTGGLIVVDNALWGGGVLSPQDDESRTIDQLNKTIKSDARVEAVLLTIRDGMQVVRKK